MGVATEVTPPDWGILLTKLWKEWETSVLVLLSLTLQVILALFGSQRKRTHNNVIRFVIWLAYIAADTVATFALGVISSNLHKALILGGSLSARIELATFWAPFLLLHLGGVQTITAFALQDTELWLKHLVSLIAKTGLVIYIVVRTPNGSRLSIPCSMMLGAGFIKYAEWTLSLWFASYNWRRSEAVKDVEWSKYPVQRFQLDDEDVEYNHDEEFLATKMFQQTERMFADAFLQDDRKSSSTRIVQTKSCSMVSKLITMELELMYENLYTKAKLNRTSWGYALRLISFLLILCTLISFSFSCLHHRHNYSTFQLSVTCLLLGVAILLEGWAAFAFLASSYRTVSWLTEHGMNVSSKAMKDLLSFRNLSWSNSMGQFSLVNSSVRPKPMDHFSKVISSLHVVVCILRKPKLVCYVYESLVKDYVKEAMHEYLNQAEAKYKGGQFSIVNSRGRVPLTTWEEQYGKDHGGGAEVDPTTTGFNFGDREFGEMVIIWHIVIEVCYYCDYDSLIGWKDEDSPPKVYRDWKLSKYLSRYLMQLYVVFSDMLPPQAPFTEKKFYDAFHDYLSLEPVSYRENNTGEMSNPEEAIKGKAAADQQKKQRRKRHKVQACRILWEKILDGRDPIKNPILVAAFKRANASKLKRNWQLLSNIWIELLCLCCKPM